MGFRSLQKQKSGSPGPEVREVVPLREVSEELFNPQVKASTPANFREPGGSERPAFHAGDPIPPLLRPGTWPRRTQFTTGQNLIVSTRTWRGKVLTPFSSLRGMADYDLIRVAITDVKGQIRGMKGQIKVRDRYKGMADSLQEKVNAAQEFLEMPDPLGDRCWDDWVGELLEEVLVTDALTLFPRFRRDGQPIGLEIVDGATIKPLIDDRGRPPLPGEGAAYQQILYGRPETEFDLDEIWYLPMNRRPDTPYGVSSTEQVMITTNLALRQQLFDLNFYTNGSLPDSLYKVPESWNQGQIEAYQEMFDELLGGRDDRRSGAVKFVPGGEGAGYVATKERAWDYGFLEFLARVICWSFGVSPIPIAKMMNRATAEALEASTLESGVRDKAQFITSIVNRYLWRVLKAPEIEHVWGSDETEDPTVVYTRNMGYVSGGIRAVDDVRKEIGDEPIGLDEPFIMTPTGAVFVSDLIAERDRRRELREAGARAAQIRDLPGTQAAPAPGTGSTEGSPETPAGIADPAAQAPPPAQMAASARAELAKWRRHELGRRKRGRKARKFSAPAMPASVRQELEDRLGEAEDHQDVRDAFTDAEHALEKALGSTAPLGQPIRKAEPSIAGQLGPQKDLEALIDGWLSGVLPDILRWAQEKLAGAVPVEAPAEKLAKIDDVPLNPKGFAVLVDDIKSVLVDAELAGAKDAGAAVGFSLEEIPLDALKYADARAAELVGMKLDPSGALIENPNPVWAVTDTIRADVNLKVAKAVEEGWSSQRLSAELADILGTNRAKMVARTETGLAYGEGASTVYEESGVSLVRILDGDGCLPKGHNDEAPKPAGTAGVFEPQNQANGQIWALETYRANLLSHPNCVRAAVPYEETT